MLFYDINRLSHNHIIGVQDNAESTGKFIMHKFIKTQRSTSEIHVFCYDRYHIKVRDELNIPNANIHFHDCLPDVGMTESKDQFEDFVMSMNSAKFACEKLIFIVDSLTTLILVKDFGTVYRLMNKLIIDPESTDYNGKIQVMLMIHEDTILNVNHTLKQLRHICRVWIHVKPSMVTVMIKRSSGKITNQTFEYRFEGKEGIVINKIKCAATVAEDDAENLPTSTFKLTLSENEKKARDAVKLPYEKTECNDRGAEEGKIFYEPDEFDDWDEEDPDNDLEFT